MEDKFKNKLDNIDVQWDKEALWDEIEVSLDKGKSKKRGFGFLFLFVCLFSIAGAYYWTILNVEADAISPMVNETSVEPTLTEPVLQEEDLTIQPVINSTSAVIPSDKVDPHLKLDDLTSYTSESNRSSDEIGIPLNEKSNLDFSSISNAQSVIKNEEKSGRDNFYSNSIILNTIKNPKTINSTKGLENYIHNRYIEPVENDPIKIFEESKMKTWSEIELLSAKTISLIAQKRLWEFRLKPSTSSLDSKQNSRFSFTLDQSIGLLRRNIHNHGNDITFFEELKELKTYERPLFYSGTQLLFDFQTKKGFSVGSGIALNNIFEVLEWESSMEWKSEEKELNDQAYFEIDILGDTTFHEGLSYELIDQTKTVIHNNRISFFSVPLNMGYIHKFGKFDVQVSAGVNFAFASRFSGRTLRPTSNDPEINIINSVEATFSKRIGYQFNLSTNYSFYKNHSVLLRVGYLKSPRLRVNDMSLDYDIINLGIGYQLTLSK